MERIEHNIPEGYEARIEGNKVILKPKESEDDRIRKEIQEFLRDNCGAGQEAYKKCEEWCYWLEKQKEQQPAEWSKEDRNNLNRITEILVRERFISAEEMKRLTNWLKSLRPQHSWKPSEEQIDALKHFIGPSIEGATVAELYDDLKNYFSL